MDVFVVDSLLLFKDLCDVSTEQKCAYDTVCLSFSNQFDLKQTTFF